jgi:hypothetical protein
METLPFFITIAGFVIGLGAVTVIDLHGFLGRKSGYWTEATTRTHKITKPLIWLGMILVLIGQILFYKSGLLILDDFKIHLAIIFLLMINGIFLSFIISPSLLLREKEGRSREVLPQILQNKITISFFVSFVGWWTLVYLFTQFIIRLIK